MKFLTMRFNVTVNVTIIGEIADGSRFVERNGHVGVVCPILCCHNLLLMKSNGCCKHENY